MPGVAGGQAGEEAVVATRQQRPGLYWVEPDVSWGAVAAV